MARTSQPSDGRDTAPGGLLDGTLRFAWRLRSSRSSQRGCTYLWRSKLLFLPPGTATSGCADGLPRSGAGFLTAARLLPSRPVSDRGSAVGLIWHSDGRPDSPAPGVTRITIVERATGAGAL